MGRNIKLIPQAGFSLIEMTIALGLIAAGIATTLAFFKISLNSQELLRLAQEDHDRKVEVSTLLSTDTACRPALGNKTLSLSDPDLMAEQDLGAARDLLIAGTYRLSEYSDLTGMIDKLTVRLNRPLTPIGPRTEFLASVHIYLKADEVTGASALPARRPKAFLLPMTTDATGAIIDCGEQSSQPPPLPVGNMKCRDSGDMDPYDNYLVGFDSTTGDPICERLNHLDVCVTALELGTVQVGIDSRGLPICHRFDVIRGNFVVDRTGNGCSGNFCMTTGNWCSGNNCIALGASPFVNGNKNCAGPHCSPEFIDYVLTDILRMPPNP